MGGRFRRLVLPKHGLKPQKKTYGTKLSAAEAKQQRIEFDRLAAALKPYFLRIKVMGADGNCVFRSLCDQLLGSPNEHRVIRSRVVEFIGQHKEYFSPFIDTDQYPTFDHYLAEMRSDGCWGTHLELQACALMVGVDICIHQLVAGGGGGGDEDSGSGSGKKKKSGGATDRGDEIAAVALAEQVRIETLTPEQLATAEDESRKQRLKDAPPTANSNGSSAPANEPSPETGDTKITATPSNSAAGKKQSGKAANSGGSSGGGGGARATVPTLDNLESYYRGSGLVLHIAYHRREHYNSIRSSQDMTRDTAPAPMNWDGPIAFADEIKTFVALLPSTATNGSGTRSGGGGGRKRRAVWKSRLISAFWLCLILLIVAGGVLVAMRLAEFHHKTNRDRYHRHHNQYQHAGNDDTDHS